MATIVDVVVEIKKTLITLGPLVAVILVVLGGITYGLAQVQPSEKRGQWQSLAVGMIIGGIIVAAVVGAAELIATNSANLLK